MPVPTTDPTRFSLALERSRPDWRMASPAAITASRLKRSMVTRRLRSMPWSGNSFTSAPMRTFSSRRGTVVISPMAERPSRMACHMAGTSVPSPQMPPRPVITTRLRMKGSGFFLGDEFADCLYDVAHVLQIAPGIDRVHLDFDAVRFLQIENDLCQLQRVDAQRSQVGFCGDLVAAGFRVFLDPCDDIFRQFVSHPLPSTTPH